MISLTRRDGRPLRIGHRGAAALAPENTLASFQRGGRDRRRPRRVRRRGRTGWRARRRALDGPTSRPDTPTLDEALRFFVDEAPGVGAHVDLKVTAASATSSRRSVATASSGGASSAPSTSSTCACDPRARSRPPYRHHVSAAACSGSPRTAAGAPDRARRPARASRWVTPFVVRSAAERTRARRSRPHHSLVTAGSVRAAHARGAASRDVDGGRSGRARARRTRPEPTRSSRTTHAYLRRQPVYTSQRDKRLPARVGAAFLAACALLGFAAAFALVRRRPAPVLRRLADDRAADDGASDRRRLRRPSRRSSRRRSTRADRVRCERRWVSGGRAHALPGAQGRRDGVRRHLDLVVDETQTVTFAPAALGARANFSKADPARALRASGCGRAARRRGLAGSRSRVRRSPREQSRSRGARCAHRPSRACESSRHEAAGGPATEASRPSGRSIRTALATNSRLHRSASASRSRGPR